MNSDQEQQSSTDCAPLSGVLTLASFDPESLVDDLCIEMRAHGCHTAILYGSRAHGDATASSDYDVAGFADIPVPRRDARRWKGSFLDAFVYPDSRLDQPDEEFLKLRGGRVLFEHAGRAARLLRGLETLFARGPTRLANDDFNTRRTWAWKMLERIQKNDVEGRYRRVWLLTVLMEDYFALRGLWYLGPKCSFQWLALHDPDTGGAFDTALQSDASPQQLCSLVERVVGSEGTPAVQPLT